MIYDHMMLDGLEDAYEAGRSMGTFGEECAEKYNFTREDQDKFAMASVQRAQDAIAAGAFKDEISQTYGAAEDRLTNAVRTSESYKHGPRRKGVLCVRSSDGLEVGHNWRCFMDFPDLRLLYGFAPYL